MCYSLWYNAPTMLPAGGLQHRGCFITQAVTDSQVLLKMGKIIAGSSGKRSPALPRTSAPNYGLPDVTGNVHRT